MSLEIKELGNGRIEIKCGDETAVVYGFVVKHPSLNFGMPHEPVVYPTISPGNPGHGVSIPPGSPGHGYSTFSLIFPITDNDQRLEIGALVAQLEPLPEFQKVLSVMRSRTPGSPGVMLITGDNKLLRE
jgi:hypothetical protein